MKDSKHYASYAACNNSLAKLCDLPRALRSSQRLEKDTAKSGEERHMKLVWTIQLKKTDGKFDRDTFFLQK